MRLYLGIALVLLSSCGGNSDRDPVQDPREKVKTREDLSNFQDFDAMLSADGQHAAFLSRREAGAYRAFLYEDGSPTKLRLLSSMRPLGEAEEESSLALSRDGKWILVERQSPSSHKLILLNWSGQLFSEIELAPQSQIIGLMLGDEAQPYLGFTERRGNTRSSKVFKFDILTAATTVIGQFDKESRPLLSSTSQGDFVLFTLAEIGNQNFWRTRKLDPSTSTWTDAESSPNLSQQGDSTAPAAASQLGLVYIETLNKPKLKPKLGSYSERPEGYVPDVGVLDSYRYLDPFAAATAPNFEAASFAANQPLTTANVSMTPDGAYALVTGNDNYFCKTRQLPVNFFQLLRMSDMAVIPLFVARTPGEVNAPWTQLSTDLCAIYDAETPELEVDGAISTAALAYGDGTTFRVVYESQRGGEKEVFRANFKVDDWPQKKLSEVAITNLSANNIP